MNFAIFLKNDFLAKNPTVKEFLAKNDNENGIADGKYSKNEVNKFIDEAISSFGIFLLGKKKISNIIFRDLDKKNKDNHISLEEINIFLKESYNLTIDDIENKTIREACDIFERKTEEKKKQKNNK